MRAVNVSVSDGNCGALDAVACADVLLDQNRADALLVGGGEAMSEALFLAFHRLGASKGQADGPCIGEGAALLLLERAEAAAARSAAPLAEVLGYGTSFAPPEREGALVHAAPDALEHAIGGALADAGVRPDEVELVVSGVSGLRVFDEAELLAVQRVVPDAPVAAPKLALGETLGAGGAMAMLAAVASLQGRASASHVVRGSVRGTPRVALVTSLGYYGNASALVMRQASR
jgi:3-oxoacyl-(acyl-carrier-protein) synthase